MPTDFKKVKIVATLGANINPKIVTGLAKRGVDVFRNNMSHVLSADVKQRIKVVRQVEKKVGRPLAVLSDLMGPKIRIGSVDVGTTVHRGEQLRITGAAVRGNSSVISVNYPSILKNVKLGAEVFLGDGAVKLEVTNIVNGDLLTRVIAGGDLRSRMGFSCHGLLVNKSVLMDKDKRDLKTLVSAGTDIIAVSFVQTERDIEAVRKLLPRKNPPMLIAKIETEQAVRNAAKILEIADGLMIARGDLGFSVPMPQIPFIQQELINLGLAKSKPIITATQMLESMIASHLPTRAEVSDVAKAVTDGTDAVMLSGETAYGKYPEEAVKMMENIIKEAGPRVVTSSADSGEMAVDAVSSSVVKIADQVKARLIIVLTFSGATARNISRHHPRQPIIALSPNPAAIRRLALSWGVRAMKAPLTKNLEHCIPIAHEVARHNPVLKLSKGETFVLSAGVPFGRSGSTNLVLIQTV